MVELTQMNKVRVRIAPSPTGYAHVGTAYVALFNLAFAKKNAGKFILRIEDTDQKREVEGGIEVIKQGLSWLGLDWDEFYRQSERLSIYQKYAKELLADGKAYEEDGGIILKVGKAAISWEDLIRGSITFPADEVKDFAILKKDGFPTYNFAVVVDDWQMGISHVIRAEEHISNTPRQISAYKALGAKVPEFAHLPLLRNPDKSKISKRKNPVALSWYKDEGFLPEALINFLCLLGWSHPEEKEIFDIKEFVEKFDLGRVRKSGPVFDTNKLLWMNQKYINNFQLSIFNSQINSFFNNKYPKDKIERVAPLVQSRIKTLKEFEDIAGFLFEEPKVDKNLLGENYKVHLTTALEAIEGGKPLENISKGNNFKTGDFFMDLRISLSGKKVTPPINESIEILGKEEAIKRLKKALK
jgi:glutamyl-tRNA synthetase